MLNFYCFIFVRFWSCLCTVYNRSKFINTHGRSKWCYCWCLRGIHDQLSKSKSSRFCFYHNFYYYTSGASSTCTGLWFLIQLSSGLNSLGIDTNGGVAWFAHIGGFIVGIGTIKYIQNYKLSSS